MLWGNDPVSQIIAEAVRAGKLTVADFRYRLQWNTLAANAQQQQATVGIDPGTAFLLQEMGLIAYSAVGTQVDNPDYLLQIQEESGANNWNSQQCHVGLWTGRTQCAAGSVTRYTLPTPRYIRGNNNVLGFLTNNTATAALVNVTLCGARINFKKAEILEDLGITMVDSAFAMY